jgi:hypothetical protein
MNLIKSPIGIINLAFLLTIIIALSPRLSFSQDKLIIEKNSTALVDDTLGNYARNFLDIQNNKTDRLDSLWDNYYTYGLFAKIGFTSDMQYQGYQGSGVQSAFFPGLFYHHPIGLGALLNAYNIKGTSTTWDEIEFGLSYSYYFTNNFSMDLSYTHFIFNDTNEIANQGISGIAGLLLTYEFPFISIANSFDVSFDGQTDYSFNISLSKKIDIIKKPSFRIWLEPDFSGTYGTQTLLNTRIINKSKGNGNGSTSILSTTSHVLAVLDYQLSIPLNVQVGRFIITPEYDYVIPFNQPSIIYAADFSFFVINVSCKIF